MPLKFSTGLHPAPYQEPVVEEVVEEVFDPEAGKASENPFAPEVGIEEEESITLVNNYESMKVTDLKGILRQRSLPVKGKKEELIARLEASDAEAASAAPVEDEEVPAEAAISEGIVSKYEGEPIGIPSDAET